MMPGQGVLNLVEFIGLIAFVFYLAKHKNLKSSLLLILWLLISVIPASLATGPGYAGNRAVAMVPVIQIISAIGIYYLFEERKFIKYLLLALGFISFTVFAEKYMFLSPHKSAEGMLYGNLEVAEYIKSSQSTYDKVVVSKSLSEPHIYIAFAEKINPLTYQEATKKWNFEELNVKWVDQMPVYELGKYTFKKYNWRDETEQNTLVIGRPDEFLEDTKTEKVIYYPNGEPSIYVKNN